MNTKKESIGTGKRAIRTTLYLPEVSQKVLIVAPAMGVNQHFYKTIAEHFAHCSYTVITFDYYGMIHTSDNKYDCGIALEDFGKKDIQEVILYAKRKFPEQQLFFLGHSLAGQVFPLSQVANEVSAAFLVASQSVSLHYWSGKHKGLIYLFWYLTIPVLVSILGYLPGFAYGGKYPLHKNVAMDWARLAKAKEGVFGGVAGAKNLYQHLRVPSYFLSFEDDDLLAPKKATQMLMESYGSKEKVHEHLSTQAKGIPAVGHFDFFRKDYAYLWDMPEKWFQKYSK